MAYFVYLTLCYWFPAAERVSDRNANFVDNPFEILS